MTSRPREFDKAIHFNPEMHCPESGIYTNVPFEQYIGWNAVSNSSLHAAMRSMKHYRLQKPLEETQSMKLGTLCHVGTFDPMMVSQWYCVMPPFERGDDGNGLLDPKTGKPYSNPKGTNLYKEKAEAFRTANIGKIIVEQSEYDKVVGMVRSIVEHPIASHHLGVTPDSLVEVAIVWVDEETGVRCKGRVDVLHQKRRVAGDLKTSNFVSAFEKQIADRSYHRQGAFYVDGLKALTGCEHGFTLTAVENAHPFDVRSAPLGNEAINAGRKEYQFLLSEIARSHDEKQWPGYASPLAWNLPSWSMPDTIAVEDGVLTSW